MLLARALGKSNLKSSFIRLFAILSLSVLVSTSFLNPNLNYSFADDEDCLKEFDIDECPDQTALILLDTRAPDITAPPDIRIVAEEEPVFIDIGKPQVFDLVDPVPVVTSDAPEDLMFKFGTTIVKWKATDMMGNTGVDYQFVTVVKHPSPTLPFKPLEDTKKRMTTLKIDPIPTNLRAGERIMLTGKLIDSRTGEGVQAVHVRILDNRPLDKRTLGVAKTDDEGKFSFIWYVNPSQRGKDRLMSVIAKFDGTPAYANSVSHDRSLKVQVERITLDLFHKKENFGSGDRVVVLAVFKTFGDKLIDPDEIEARFNGREVTMIRKGIGIYEYMSLANSKAPHLFTVHGIKFPEDRLPFGSVVGSVVIT